VLKSCEADVQVSLEGAKKETHEFIRGKGTYDKTIRGIKTLVHAAVYTRIGMTR
jgi:MoaA/NifB/PqqE/SkfB family radical SAM enzyme